MGNVAPTKGLYNKNLIWDGSNWVEWDGNSSMDLTADIEITGTPCTNRGSTPASSGSNTLVSVAAGFRIKLYKAILSVSADITGEVYLSIGATKIGSVQYPKQGGQYFLISTFPDYEHGADGDDLTLNLPSATTVSINISYEVEAA